MDGVKVSESFLSIFKALQRKEKEMSAIAAKIEDEQTLGSKMVKQVKELGVSRYMYNTVCAV